MFIHKDIKEALPNVNYNIILFLKLNSYYILYMICSISKAGIHADPRLENETILYFHLNEHFT